MPSQLEWLTSEIEGLTEHLEIVTPSQWAEKYRYLPSSVSPLPGQFSFKITPYLREIVDCLAIDSPIRRVSVIKGVQICATTGILENALGYVISYVKDAPCMLLTADSELAKLRLEQHIIPMLHHSGLADVIQSVDEGNKRKTGKTSQRLEWQGGGYMIPFGAQNANKLRSVPIRFMFRDEVDGYPLTVGKDGDPMRLSEDRTAAYEGARKILDLSTPLLKGQSQIEAAYLQGDRRQYYIRCLKCNYPQRLRWRRINPDTGEESGMIWQMDRGTLVPGSVRYKCRECGHEHSNDDKTRLLAPENGAEWKPTAEPTTKYHRSYKIPALYSPANMQSWEACVSKWLDAWDVENNRSKDNAKLQVFWNNVLAETFEQRGERVKFQTVSVHRRACYKYGEIPNTWAEQHCGSHVLLLTCAVDVHGDNLAVAVFGWTRDRRAILIDYWRWYGDTEQLDCADTWIKLQDLLEQKVYTSDDGRNYQIMIAMIDSGYRAEQVYRFCGEYPAAHVYPVKGREAPTKSATQREFSEFVPVPGQKGYIVAVDPIKDRWSAAFRRQWDGMGQQPAPYFNAPRDATDAQIKELTAETKREKIEKTTGKRVGWEWHRPSGAANELFDTLVYSSAALDIMAYGWSVEQGLEFTNYPGFYDAAAQAT